MRRERIQLTPETAERFLSQVLGDDPPSTARIVFPAVLSQTAEAIASTLNARGISSEIDCVAEDAFRQTDPVEASKGWVPEVGDTPTLLVLLGAQPWETSFDGDHWVEIEAMKRREGLIAAGHRLVFIDWPRGARLDREVDLRAADMARIYTDSLTIDYDAMRATNAQLLDAVAGATEVQITCPEGTNLSLSVTGRRWLAEDCALRADEPAIFLPGGEIYVSVQEDSAEGQVAFRYCGERRIAIFSKGILQCVRRPDESRDSNLEEEFGAGVEPLCEFGVGTNAWAPPWQIGTIYEKSSGTVHVAVGGNAHFGGERDSPRHADLIIREPTVTLLGRCLALPGSKWKAYGYTRGTTP